MTIVGNGADILSTPNSSKNGGFGWCEVPKNSNGEKLSRVGRISHEIQKNRFRFEVQVIAENRRVGRGLLSKANFSVSVFIKTSDIIIKAHVLFGKILKYYTTVRYVFGVGETLTNAILQGFSGSWGESQNI